MIRNQKLMFLLFDRIFRDLNVEDKELKVLCKMVYSRVNSSVQLFKERFFCEEALCCCIFVFALQVLYNTNNLRNERIFGSRSDCPLARIVRSVRRRARPLRCFVDVHRPELLVSLKYAKMEDLADFCSFHPIADACSGLRVSVTRGNEREEDEGCPNIAHAIYDFKGFFTVESQEIPKTVLFFLEVFCDLFDCKEDFLVKENQKFYIMAKLNLYFDLLNKDACSNLLN